MLLDIHLFDRASHADVVDGEFICIRGCSVGGANLRLWVELNLKLSIHLSGVYISACRAPARLLSLRGLSNVWKKTPNCFHLSPVQQ